MTSEFQNRLEDARKLVAKESVKNHLIENTFVKWVVVGNKRDYLVRIDPFWCRCYDFQNNVLHGHLSQCKHIIAVQIADREEKFQSFYLNKDEYDFIRNDLLFS